MKNLTHLRRFAAVAGARVALPIPPLVQAHCHGLDGPVVEATQQALYEGNVNLVLVRVQPADETKIRLAFENTRTVRRLSDAARDVADRYFFETLERIDRAGEGAAYTRLKPAGRDHASAIPLGDNALETSNTESLVHLFSKAMEHGLRKHSPKPSKEKGGCLAWRRSGTRYREGLY